MARNENVMPSKNVVFYEVCLAGMLKTQNANALIENHALISGIGGLLSLLM